MSNRILEKGLCKTKPKLEGAEKALIQTAKTALATTTVALMPLNTSGGISVVKTVQIFDYIGFIDIEKPTNSEAVLEMFNSNFLSLIPNLFSNQDFEGKDEMATKAGTQSQQRIMDGTNPVEKFKCEENQVM